MHSKASLVKGQIWSSLARYTDSVLASLEPRLFHSGTNLVPSCSCVGKKSKVPFHRLVTQTRFSLRSNLVCFTRNYVNYLVRKVSNGEKPSFITVQEKNRMTAMKEMRLKMLIESYLELDQLESPESSIETIAMMKLILMRLITRIARESDKNIISKYPSPFNLV